MKELNEEKLKYSSKKFRVNEVTAFFGITPRILKHYETTGILAPARTDKNDYREYSAEDVMKIQSAERLKITSLTQREIGEYFSGELNIEKKYGELIKLREMVDNLIDVLGIDLKNGAPQFSVENEQSQLCFCKTYPATTDALQQYMNSRDAYSSAISARCICDVTHTFFSQYDNLFSFPRADDIDTQPEQSKDRTYRVCVPIIAPPENDFFDGTAETVTRKKSLIMKIAFAGKPVGDSGYMLQEEARRRGLTLTGKAWGVSETGPNRKTANRTQTLIYGAEIE